MLVSIEVMPPMMTITRRRQRRGAESDGRSHKKGHRCQQQLNSEYDETPTTTTSEAMLVYQQRQQLQDADGDNGNN